LVVPIKVDALCLPVDRLVTPPLADFTRLPYVDPDDGHDHGVEPYVSEALLSEPFQGEGLLLKAGVHLHWTLPDVMSRLDQRDGDTSVPAVPNRWLVTRSVDGTVQQQWIVESDFLAEDNLGGVPYPYIAEQMSGLQRLPYRRLGRRVPLSAWRPATDRSRYLRRLTAIGYGEPTFASFYPHCHSVFGLHDPMYRGAPPAAVGYDVLGWYEQPGDDLLAAVLARAEPKRDWREYLGEVAGWTSHYGGPAPSRVVCWGRLRFTPDTTQPAAGDGAGERDGVWMGNTATEALAAHLGDVLPDARGDEMESLLEAIAFADNLESEHIDLGVKLMEARHADTFRNVPGGDLWSVRMSAGTELDLAALPADAGAALNALNGAQSARDRAVRQLGSLREELYADWYRYMLCAYRPDGGRDDYPGPDEALHHVRRRVAVVDRQAGNVSALDRTLAAAQAAVGAVLPGGYELQRGAAPQFYEPNEPVVLITGAPAIASDRFGQDGPLDCAVVEGEIPDAAKAAGALRGVVAAAVPEALRVWAEPTWHPLLLQWEVEFFPAGRSGNLGGASRDFGADFIAAGYGLAADQVELPLLDEQALVLSTGANVYTGTTVLSAAASPVLADRVLRYLAKPVLAALDGKVSEREYADDPVSTFDRYLAGGRTEPRLVTLIGVYRHLAGNEINALAQSLGGFNDALVMRRLVRQLPVADPLGFPTYREITEREVAPAVADGNRHTPQPSSSFNPIRAGALRLLRLRLIDTFGVSRDIGTDSVGTTTQLRLTEHPEWVNMPPRIAQPARLSVRWLDAGSGTEEMNAVPATTPVCGWLLSNHLDSSIAVHAADGPAIGGVYALPGGSDGTAAWRSAPGRPPVGVSEIDDAHLRAVVERLIADGPDAVGLMAATIDAALGAIEPDTGTQPGRALLVSRPVAVVRASVRLELAGRPARDQDWNVFRQDLRRTGCETNGFERVLFPIRLGDHGRLGDGLIGFWEEGPAGRLDPRFRAVPEPDATVLQRSFADPASTLTMLVDPRGAVHACCGILPAKSLRIPDEHYRRALESLAVTFLTAPVLGDLAQAPSLPLPDEPGFLWSWLERDVAGWTQIGAEPLVGRTALTAAFPGHPTLWSDLIGAGWLLPLDADTALVAPADRRPPAPVGLAAIAAELAVQLTPDTLTQPRTDAGFPARLAAREGWLTLRSRPTPTVPSAPD
jgi:hypothetical protein